MYEKLRKILSARVDRRGLTLRRTLGLTRRSHRAKTDAAKHLDSPHIPHFPVLSHTDYHFCRTSDANLFRFFFSLPKACGFLRSQLLLKRHNAYWVVERDVFNYCVLFRLMKSCLSQVICFEPGCLFQEVNPQQPNTHIFCFFWYLFPTATRTFLRCFN